MMWRLTAHVTPYAGVAVGLFALKSAWWAVVLYQGVMLVGILAGRPRCASGRWPWWWLVFAIYYGPRR